MKDFLEKSWENMAEMMNDDDKSINYIPEKEFRWLLQEEEIKNQNPLEKLDLNIVIPKCIYKEPLLEY